MRPVQGKWHGSLQIIGFQSGSLCDSGEHTRTTGSCRNRKEIGQLWNRFAVVETIGDDTKSQGLGLGYRFIPGLPVGHHAGQVRHLGNPPAVFFSIKLDSHVLTSTAM